MTEAKRIVDAETGSSISSGRVVAALVIGFITFLLYKMLNSGVYHGQSRGRIFNIYADDLFFYIMLPVLVAGLFGMIWTFGKSFDNFTTTHALAGVLGITALLALTTVDPSGKYSTQEFWQTATITDVHEIPEEALEWGNDNGAVLMWAAVGTSDPAIIRALIDRGASVTETDELYGATALSAAAVETMYPAIIDVLIENGARINKSVGQYKKSPIILAAELNKNPRVVERLIEHGANLSYQDVGGNTALDAAKRMRNIAVLPVLEQSYASLED